MKTNNSQQNHEEPKKGKKKMKSLLDNFYEANEECMFQSETIGALFSRPASWVHLKCKQKDFIPNVNYSGIRYFIKKDVMKWINDNKHK